MKTGTDLIREERAKQITRGFSEDHDKQHDDGALALNAAILASPQVLYQKEKFANSESIQAMRVSDSWRLPNPAFRGNVIIDNSHLDKRERIKQLVVAGALIAAEIDRLQK